MDPPASAEASAAPPAPASKPSKRQPPRSSAQLAAGVRPLPSGGVFKSAAVEVLRRERRLMPSGEICRLALEWGLLRCSGKTPEATMASCLYSDVKRGGSEGGGGSGGGSGGGGSGGGTPSLFIRPTEGMFGLREWVEQGILPPEALNAAPVQGPAAQGRVRQRKRSAAAAAAAGEPAAAAAPNPRLEMAGQNQGEGEFDLFYRFRVTSEEGAAPAAEPMAPAPAVAARPPPPQPEPRVFQNSAPVAPVGEWAADTPALPPTAWQPRRRLTSDGPGPEPHVPPVSTVPTSGEVDVQAALEGAEAKALAVEERWGPLHPQSGRAHLLLYSAYSQHCPSESQGTQRALAALMRAYDIMMFNLHVEQLGKLRQGGDGAAAPGGRVAAVADAAAQAPQPRF